MKTVEIGANTLAVLLMAVQEWLDQNPTNPGAFTVQAALTIAASKIEIVKKS